MISGPNWSTNPLNSVTSEEEELAFVGPQYLVPVLTGPVEMLLRPLHPGGSILFRNQRRRFTVETDGGDGEFKENSRLIAGAVSLGLVLDVFKMFLSPLRSLKRGLLELRNARLCHAEQSRQRHHVDCPTPRLEKSPVSPKVVVKKKRGRPPGPSRQRAAKKAPILEDESEESQDGSKANRKAKRRYLGQEHNAAKRTRKLTDRDSATPSHVSRSRSPSTSTSSCFKYEDLGAPLILKYDDVSPSTPTARRPNLSSAASVTSSIRQGSYSSAISLLIDEEEQEQKPDREVIVVGPVAAPIVYEEDDDIIFIPQPKEEPEDEIQCIEPAPAQFRQPAPVPKVAPEVASSAPALSNAPDDSTLSLTEFSIKKLIFSFLNDLFTVDPELFCKTVVCLENDKKKEGLVYLMSATLNSRTNQYTEEFMELLANSNQDETYANADWRQYSNYTAEFRSRCSLADIMKDELSPKTFFEIIESIMDIEKQFLEYVASHEEINNDFTKQIVAEAVTSLIARIAASTFQMATLTHIHWAPAEYVRRRLRMIANGWQEFIRKGGLYKIMQFKMRSLEPSAFSEFVDKRLEETDDRLNLAISLLTIPADGLKNKILNEMEVSAEEFEFMVTNTTFDDNKHYSYPCTQCRGLVPRFRDEESLEIHNRLLHSTDCDCHMCFDDFPNKTALTLHILIKHQGDLSAEDE
ncbi:unnamed protein product [Caenorhabditis auriculariae]|uniref:C2H2-type domain-containing protein n=1 Tax=Caenorhabditis auriculariae TaxID=2777116 RepID=A0A8S1HAH8_9PELO|nr:unnamed protein product [Caenorhabditis auriculariae]